TFHSKNSPSTIQSTCASDSSKDTLHCTFERLYIERPSEAEVERKLNDRLPLLLDPERRKKFCSSPEAILQDPGFKINSPETQLGVRTLLEMQSESCKCTTAECVKA